MALFALPLKAQPLWQTVIGSIIITSLFVFASVRMVSDESFCSIMVGGFLEHLWF